MRIFIEPPYDGDSVDQTVRHALNIPASRRDRGRRCSPRPIAQGGGGPHDQRDAGPKPRIGEAGGCAEEVSNLCERRHGSDADGAFSNPSGFSRTPMIVEPPLPAPLETTSTEMLLYPCRGRPFHL